MTAGDPATSGATNQFGEHIGGGRYYGTSGGSSRFGDYETIGVGPFDPESGKIVKEIGLAKRGRQRPVDVPEGWKLSDAFRNLKAIEDRQEEAIELVGDQIEATWNAMRANKNPRAADGKPPSTRKPARERECTVCKRTRSGQTNLWRSWEVIR